MTVVTLNSITYVGSTFFGKMVTRYSEISAASDQRPLMQMSTATLTGQTLAHCGQCTPPECCRICQS